MKNEPDRPLILPCLQGGKRRIVLDWLLVALLFMALLSLAEGVYSALQFTGGVDCQYSGAHLMMNGENPYDTWLKGDTDRFLLTQRPNYLPNLLYLLAPIAVLDWPAAKCLWMIVNLALAGWFAWMLYAAQKPGLGKYCALLIALFFLSSQPVRFSIELGQQSLLILVATTWALRLRAKPILSGMAFSVAMTKYSVGAFFLVAELACRRFFAAVVAAVIIVAAYAGLSIQTHVPFNLRLLLEPLNVARTGVCFEGYFFWLDQHCGSVAVGLLPLIGLVIVFLRARALAASGLPANEIDMKLACGAACMSLLFAPHIRYDFVLLALPLALGCRLDQLKKFERYLFAAILLARWNLASALEALQLPILTTAKNVVLTLALAVLACLFLASRSNQAGAAQDTVKQ
jgi:hypothetical protein